MRRTRITDALRRALPSGSGPGRRSAAVLAVSLAIAGGIGYGLTAGSKSRVADKAPSAPSGGSTVTVVRGPQPGAACARAGYSRTAFGDEPSAATRVALVYLTANVDGSHTDPYTLERLDVTKADADHLVPLAYAWDHGACQWPRELRVRFAADLTNLRLTSASLNRSKGDRAPGPAPDGWLPPKMACSYLADFARITYEYRMTLDAALDAARAEACPS